MHMRLYFSAISKLFSTRHAVALIVSSLVTAGAYAQSKPTQTFALSLDTSEPTMEKCIGQYGSTRDKSALIEICSVAVNTCQGKGEKAASCVSEAVNPTPPVATKNASQAQSAAKIVYIGSK
jgi:hypothetical protein